MKIILFRFDCEHLLDCDIQELILDGKLDGSFLDVYQNLPDDEEWNCDDIIISKKDGKYIMEGSIYQYDDEEIFDDESIVPIDIGEDRLFEFISTLASFGYTLI